MLGGAISIAIFIMYAAARRLPISLCASQTRGCAIQAQFQFRIHPECRRMYAKYSMLIGKCTGMHQRFGPLSLANAQRSAIVLPVLTVNVHPWDIKDSPTVERKHTHIGKWGGFHSPR
jgi:hypothetical protein